MGSRNFGNVIRPLFPVAPIANFLHQLGINRALEFSDLILKLTLSAFRRFGNNSAEAMTLARWRIATLSLLNFVSDGDDFHLAGVGTNKLEFVHHRIKAVIV